MARDNWLPGTGGIFFSSNLLLCEGGLSYLVFMANTIMPGQECEEVLTWFVQFHISCKLSQYPMLRAFILLHHCACICSRVRVLVATGDLDELLSILASNLQGMDWVEHIAHSLSHQEAMTSYVVDFPVTPYTWAKHAYQNVGSWEHDHMLGVPFPRDRLSFFSTDSFFFFVMYIRQILQLSISTFYGERISIQQMCLHPL